MIKKICNKFIKQYFNFIMPFQYRIENAKLDTNDDMPSIIVSLTSIPSRMDRIYISIQSILLQSVKPDKIILYLGKDKFEGIKLPQKLLDLKRSGLEIRFCEDIKPHTKYYYAMQEFQDSIVITVDDDILYRKNMIHDLLFWHAKYPKCVICTRAHKIKFTSDGKLGSYNDWDFETSEYGFPSKYFFATGVGGVLYPPKCMDQELFNLGNIKKLTYMNDDIWLKGMQLQIGTEVVVIPHKIVPYCIGIEGAEKVTLNSVNVHQNKNDVQLRAVFDNYNIKEEMFI